MTDAAAAVSTNGGTDPPPPGYETRPTWKNAKIKDKSVWFKCDCGPLKLSLNPVVTICSVVIIIAFIVWCTVEPDRKLLYDFDEGI